MQGTANKIDSQQYKFIRCITKTTYPNQTNNAKLKTQYNFVPRKSDQKTKLCTLYERQFVKEQHYILF